jgi:AraC-like DNA-binding protein/mannose-6-phosphate isomerase-like protein (cupin superfamily)
METAAKRFSTSPSNRQMGKLLRLDRTAELRGLTGGRPVDGDWRDALSDTLRGIRLTASVLLNASLASPFRVAVRPDQMKAATRLAAVRDVSMFYLVVSGGCTLETDGGERHDVSAGDFVLMPVATGHTFHSGDGGETVSASELLRPGAPGELGTLQAGGNGDITRIVCGLIDTRELNHAPMLRSLPPLLVVRTGDDQVSALMVSAVHELVLPEAVAPASELAIGRMMELLLIEVLQRYASQLPVSAKGWLAALCDPVVGRALQAMHRDAARRWTVSALAREAGTSRSVLSERFRAMVGQPPIEYLANWRIQLAARRLRSTDDCLAAVAAASGYDSQAAFHRAFKRIAGVAPGRWREAG